MTKRSLSFHAISLISSLFLITMCLFVVSTEAAEPLQVISVSHADYSGQMQNSFLGSYGSIYLVSTIGTNYGVLLENAGSRTYSQDQTNLGNLTLFYSGHPLYAQNYTQGTMTINYTNQSGSFTTIIYIPNVTMSPAADGTSLYYDDAGRPWFDSSLNLTPAMNSPPAFSLTNQTVGEAQSIQFSVSAADPDGDAIIIYAASGLQSGAAFNETTNIFNWSPTYEQSGSYPVTFYANDSFSQGQTTIFITVNNVNRLPVLNSIGSQSVNENSTLNFTVSGNDPDAQPFAFGASSLPQNSNWDNATGTFNWTPSFSLNGTYSVIFNITDETDTASETVVITVNNINAGPWFLSLVGNQSVNENSTLAFEINATDPDNDALVYSINSTSPLPAGMSINATTGLFNWTPSFSQSGNYVIDLNASDGIESISETITITVNNLNAGPELAAIGDKTGNESQILDFTVSASDPDNDPLTFGIQNKPDGASFDSITRVFNWSPSYTQNGTYYITFNVTDGLLFNEENITITIMNVNRVPTLNLIGNKSVLENENLNFTVEGIDPDGENVYFSAHTLPEGASFDPAQRLFNWTTNLTNNGTYIDVAFNVTDGIATTEEPINITVENVNIAPTLNAINSQSVNENQTLSFTVVASDPDDEPLVFYLENYPPDAAINSTTGVFTWTPNFTQAGNYSNVLIGANDSLAISTQTFTITVTAQNAGPELAPIGDKVTDENITIDFIISASDLDNDALTFSILNKPDSATFNTASGRFIWIPDFTQNGTFFDIVFNVSDGTFWDSENISITVNNVNRRPVLDSIGDKTVNESQLLTFTLNANDPDGDSIIYTASGYPAAANFSPVTRVFSWTPGMNDAGTYPGILFNATDSSLNASETITITVLNVNQAPTLNAIEDQTVMENSTLNFTLSGSDPDGDVLAFAATTELPAGANFNNMTLIFNWTPNLIQNGTYIVGFNVSDGMLNFSRELTITVSNLNLAPVFNNTPDQSVAELQTLAFVVDGTDPDNDSITIVNSTLPEGAVFNFSTRNFSWTPGLGSNGTYIAAFIISDGDFNVSINVTIIVSSLPRSILDSNIFGVLYQNNFNSDVTNAVVNNSIIISTNITNSSGAFVVDINESFFNNSVAADASWFENCTLINSNFLRGECMNFAADNSYVSDSNVTGFSAVGSSAVNSTIANSNSTNSAATGSTLVYFTGVDNSEINQTLLNNSVISNSTVINSTITGAILNNSLVIDNVIYNGTVIFNDTETSITEPRNLSEFINYAPIAFLSAPSSAIAGDLVLCDASASRDDNIPGELNDTLEYVFYFGNGANYTEGNLSYSDGAYDGRTSYAYSSAGTYNAQVVVTDRFGLSDSANTTITISAPQQSQQSSGGGGGGGGGGGSYYASASVPEVRTFETNLMQYSWQSMLASKYQLNFKSLNATVTSIEFELNENITNHSIAVEILGSAPTAEELNNTYTYIEFDSGLPEENLSNIKIYFRVEKSWLNSSGINSEDIRLYHYVISGGWTSGWTMLITDHVKLDSKYEYYAASSPGFSYFAISTIKAKSAAAEPSEPVLKFVTSAANETAANLTGTTAPLTVTIIQPKDSVEQSIPQAELNQSKTTKQDSGMAGITGAAILKSRPAQIWFVALLLLLIIIFFFVVKKVMRKQEYKRQSERPKKRRKKK